MDPATVAAAKTAVKRIQAAHAAAAAAEADRNTAIIALHDQGARVPDISRALSNGTGSTGTSVSNIRLILRVAGRKG